MKLFDLRITLFSGVTGNNSLSPMIRDPICQKKFQKYGGRVLIAVKSDIEASLKRLSMRKAEGLK